MMVNRFIKEHVIASERAASSLVYDPHLMDQLTLIADDINQTFAQGSKVMIIGNGGSAADAQHFAAELVGRYKRPGRAPLPAIALTTDTSALTAIGNDFGFEDIFVRQLQALAQEDDALVALSTSGNSENIIRALDWANDNGLSTLGFTARNLTKSNKMLDRCDYCFAPTEHQNSTAIIQQCHMIGIHAICDAIDEAASNLT